jgi:ubiquitin carboxyl-terminal hydrolase 36/42
VPHAKLLFSYELFLQIVAGTPMPKRAPAAFANVGNSCYANAIIQCMMGSRPLRAYLDSRLHEKTCCKPKPEDWCLVCELQVSCCRGQLID